MPCCKPYVQSGNSALTDIQYTAAMQQTYGPLPKIDVLYLDESGEYRFAGEFTQVQFNGDSILVDHGGPARWLIRVS